MSTIVSPGGHPDRVRLIVSDVDGVLTDGRITFDDQGGETKSFHVRDGSGVKYALRAGVGFAVITGRRSPIVDRRMAELGVEDVTQGARDKSPAFEELLARKGLRADETAYVGDDLVDLPILRRVAFAVAVPDAVAEVREAAHYVTACAGGRGAIREVVEIVLRARGRWEDIVARYREDTP